MTIKKTVSINEANKWLNAIINKAIDCGEIYTRYFTYEDAFNKTKVTAVTYYEVSENLTVEAFDDCIDVIYYSDDSVVRWTYNFTV